MDAVSTEDLVLASILEAASSPSKRGSARDRGRSAPLSSVTESVTTGEQQLGNQVEIAVAVTTLAEQGYLDREPAETTERLTLTETGNERATSVRDRLAGQEIDIVDDDARETRSLADAAKQLDRSVVELAADCGEDGVYYLHDTVPTEELVGRDSELERCRELLDDALQARRGQILVLSGASGVGKTTLVDTVLSRTPTTVDPLHIHCQEAGGEPYQPIRDALDQLGTEPPFATVGFEAEEPEDYEAQQAALFHDVTDLLTPEDGIRVLFLDDIDHADVATWTYIEYLADRIRELPLVIIGTHRPGTLPDETPISPGTANEDAVTRLGLTGLGRDDTRRLIAQILGRQDVPGEFVDAIHERTDGNPLFVETTIDTLIESNQLDPQFQWYPEDVDAIDLPDAVQDIIIQRIESLDRETRQVVEWVAVAGEAITVSLLADLASLSVDHVGTIVEALVDGEMFSAEQIGDERWVTIRNDVVREALLADAEQLERRHAALADALSAHESEIEGADTVEQASTIAYHYERAGDSTAAIEWYRRAAEQATAVYAHEAASDHYHSVLDIARETGDEDVMLSAGHDLAAISLTTSEYEQADRYVQFVRERTPPEETGRRRETARLEAEIATKRSEFADAIEAAEDGLGIGEERDRLHCRLLAVKAEAEWRKSDYEAAESTCEQCRELATELRDSALEAEATELLAMIEQGRAEYDRAREFHEQALATTRDLDDQHREADILNRLGIAAMRQGRTEEAREYYEDGLAVSEEIGDRHQAAKIYTNLGNIAIDGSPEQAREYYERALETGKAVGDQHLVADVRVNLGMIAGGNADFEAARAHVEAALPMYETTDDDHRVALAKHHLGDHRQTLGEYERAREEYEASLELYREVGDDFGIAGVLESVGLLGLNQGRYAAAEEALAEARERAETLENPVTRGGILTEQAWLAYHRERYSKARRLATEAREILVDGTDAATGDALHVLGATAIECDEYGTARDHLGEARDRFVADSSQHYVAIVDRERGRLARETGEYDRAAELLESALETLEAAGYVHEIARTQQELGRLAAATDDRDRARDHWKQALETFDELDARTDAVETLEALVSRVGDGEPESATAWCDRAIDLLEELETDGAEERREWFEERREQLSSEG